MSSNDKKRPNDERLAKLVGTTTFRDMSAALGKVDPLSGAGVQLAWALAAKRNRDGTPDARDIGPYVLASYVVGFPLEHEKIGNDYLSSWRSEGYLARGLRRLSCYVALGELCGQKLNEPSIARMLKIGGSSAKAFKILVDSARSYLYTELSEAAARFGEASKEAA